MRARQAMAIQLLCGGVASRYGDNSYFGSKVSLQTDSKSCWRPSWQKINPKQNLVTSSDGSQMVTGTKKVARKPRQRRCPKSVLTALTSDYLTALVMAAVLPSPASHWRLQAHSLPVHQLWCPLSKTPTFTSACNSDDTLAGFPAPVSSACFWR